jgi:hypothetical protein
MSCDTDYKLTVYSENKKYLQDLKKYCKFKKERWDSWSASGKNADELLKETGRLLFMRGIVSQGESRVAAFSGTIRKPSKK